MKTLIELYDERPIENVLATDVFRPERTVFLCTTEVIGSRHAQDKMREYFRRRGLDTDIVFIEASLYDTAKIKKQLQKIVDSYEDCVLDITGGTDAALFAAGQLCAESAIPVFTYSRKRGRFYNIHNAPFADKKTADIRYNIEDCFLMAGGAMRSGRVDNGVLSRYMDMIEPFFALYLDYRREWLCIVNYIQRASQGEKGMLPSLHVRAPYTVKGDRSSRISAPEQALRDMEKLGFISGLDIVRDNSVEFDFKDLQVRTWLRDIGSVLELYVYKACVDTGAFHEVYTSAVVDWEGDFKRDSVTNEIDVMAMNGIVPAFISCKTSDISTEALNELAILRDRFGGRIAKAAIVTTQSCRSITRHRAAELNIDVIDIYDIRRGGIKSALISMMRTEN